MKPSAARPATGFPVTRRRRGCRSPIPTSSVNASAPACYIPESIPASLYLAKKYHNDFEVVITAIAKVSGGNRHCGAVVGSWLGATAKWLENRMLQAGVAVD